MISTKEHDDQCIIEIVTCSEMRIGVDATKKGKGVEQWIRKETEPTRTFNPQKEKEAYQQAMKVILGPDWIASMSKTPRVYDMPSVYDRTIP
jgi:hypothetical protein